MFQKLSARRMLLPHGNNLIFAIPKIYEFIFSKLTSGLFCAIRKIVFQSITFSRVFSREILPSVF